MEQTAPTIQVGDCISDVETVFAPQQFSGRQYTPNYRTLCSIFPEALEHLMLHAGGRKKYALPAVPKGKYALLRVYDTWTLVRDLSRSAGAEDDADGDAKQQAPVYCQGIADDLIRIWAGDAPGNASGAKPGITVIGGDQPSQLELDSLYAIQTTYFRWLVMKADENWIIGKRELITEDHRRALRWLGSEDRDWYKKIQAVLLKRCPSCAEEINQLATVCRFCQGSLIKFYRDLGIEVTEDIDPGVFLFQKTLKERTVINNEKIRAEKAAAQSAQPK